jgi:hypothetical protein
MASKNLLLVNPWVQDFKCYDEWMEPLGLIWISALLEPFGVQSSLIDCLDRFALTGDIRPGKSKQFSTGDFAITELEKPAIYREIPRKYKQYGISENACAPAPSLI